MRARSCGDGTTKSRRRPHAVRHAPTAAHLGTAAGRALAMMAVHRSGRRAGQHAREGDTETMARTSARRSASQVIRTYAAADRASGRALVPARAPAGCAARLGAQVPRAGAPRATSTCSRWSSSPSTWPTRSPPRPAARRAPGGRAPASCPGRAAQARERDASRAGRGDTRPALRRRASAPHPQRLSRRCRSCPSTSAGPGSASMPTTSAGC